LAEAAGMSGEGVEGTEEGLAALDAMHESVPARDIGGIEMTDAAQAVFEELQQQASAAAAPADNVKAPALNQGIAGATQTPAGQRIVPPVAPQREREQKQQRGEPEAG